MSQKFTYEGYTICVTFRSDNALAITASFNLTGQHFLNDMVQLGKIKKDTVLATLAKKNPKNLWCRFKMVDSNPRKLVISFVVNFDYLPQFSEDLVLDYVQIKGQSLNKISSVQLQTDIDQIQKVLDAINKNGTVNIHQKISSVNQKTAITSFQVNQGAYLLQITGVLVNATTVHDTIEFFIKQDYCQQQISLKQKSYSQHGYAYPYFFSYKIDSKGGKIQISAKNQGSGTASLSNQVISLVPILGKA